MRKILAVKGKVTKSQEEEKLKLVIESKQKGLSIFAFFVNPFTR
jgi:hypothetical protein